MHRRCSLLSVGIRDRVRAGMFAFEFALKFALEIALLFAYKLRLMFAF